MAAERADVTGQSAAKLVGREPKLRVLRLRPALEAMKRRGLPVGFRARLGGFSVSAPACVGGRRRAAVRSRAVARCRGFATTADGRWPVRRRSGRRAGGTVSRVRVRLVGDRVDRAWSEASERCSPATSARPARRRPALTGATGGDSRHREAATSAHHRHKQAAAGGGSGPIIFRRRCGMPMPASAGASAETGRHHPCRRPE